VLRDLRAGACFSQVEEVARSPVRGDDGKSEEIGDHSPQSVLVASFFASSSRVLLFACGKILGSSNWMGEHDASRCCGFGSGEGVGAVDCGCW